MPSVEGEATVDDDTNTAYTQEQQDAGIIQLSKAEGERPRAYGY